MVKKLVLFAILFFFTSAVSVFAQPEGEVYPQVRLGLGKKPEKGYCVLRVDDFQTLELEGLGTVRLIGVSEIDTDSLKLSEDFQSAENVIQKLIGGKLVDVFYDDMYEVTGNKDATGNILAYIFLIDGVSQSLWCEMEYERIARIEKEQGIEPDPAGIRKQKIDFCKHEFAIATKKHDLKVSLNALLIRDGYARVSIERPFTFRETFNLLEADAKANRRGLWAKSDSSDI